MKDKFAIFLCVLFSLLILSIFALEVRNLVVDMSTPEDKPAGATKFTREEGWTVATSGQIAVTSSAQILASTTEGRPRVSICNTDSTDNVVLSFRADAVPTSGYYDYFLKAATCWDAVNLGYEGAIRASSTADSVILTVTEWQY